MYIIIFAGKFFCRNSDFDLRSDSQVSRGLPLDRASLFVELFEVMPGGLSRYLNAVHGPTACARTIWS